MTERVQEERLKCDGCGRGPLPGEDGSWQRLAQPIVGNGICPECQKIDAEPTEEEQQQAALDQALAERDRLAEALVQIQTAEPEIRRAPITDERYVSRTAEDVMRDIADGALVAHYEALKEEAK